MSSTIIKMKIIPTVRNQRLINLGTSLMIFLLAAVAVDWRLDMAPDVFTDEILYTRAGIRAAAEGALVWDHGEPLFVHPPLYFLALGTFLLLLQGIAQFIRNIVLITGAKDGTRATK